MKSLFLMFCMLLLFSGINAALASTKSEPTPVMMPEEGMWLPILIKDLNYQDMVKLGLKLTPEQIFSVNTSSLKDAIVIFGGGCTGEMISPEGLILTNHHCGYGQIQAHSTIEHDYLKNGFWAMTKEAELPNPGLSVKFLVKMEDVTARILARVNDAMDYKARTDTIAKVMREIESEAKGKSHYITNVKPFFAGNAFYLFVYEEFRDVRLVGTPPSAIGKFGADNDNWMWPRHTGDFSLFRVYADKDGKPADYSKDNIPYNPKYFLPVSLKGVNKGDFAMIMGNPGTTERYLTSFGIKLALEIKNPAIIKIRTEKLEVWKKDMDASDAIRIQYASKYARTSNYWKYYQGQSRGIIRNDVYEKKKDLEEKFNAWVKSSDENMRKYGTVLKDFEEAYAVISQFELPRRYFMEAIWQGGEIVQLAASYRGLYDILNTKEPDQAKLEKETARLKKNLDAFFKDYNMPTDRKLFAAMLKMYYKDVPKQYQPPFLAELYSKFKGNWDAYTDYVYTKSIFIDKNKLSAFLAKPSKKILDKDPAYIFMKSFTENYLAPNEKLSEAMSKLDVTNRIFLNGLMEMQKDKKFYPDANFTMRLTYGTVQDYFPADAVYYNFYTTLDGIMEKEDSSNYDFIVPDKLKELYKSKNYGRYGETDSKGNKIMKVCFLTTHDITGGNSGSPVIDANGNLIGLAFDGNWEAMSGDIAYEPSLQRTINVDIRYVLFIIDKFAGAEHLISEMKIIQ